MNLLALLFSDKKNLATGQNSTPVSSKVDFTALLDRLQHSSSTHSARKTQQPILPQDESMLLDKSLEHSSFMIDDKSFLSTYEHTSLDMKTRSSKAVTASQKRLLVKSFDKNKELQAPLKRKINTNMQNPMPLVQRKFKKDLTRSSWYSDEKISSSYKEPLHKSKSYTSSSLYKQEKSTPHRSSSQSVLTQTPVVLAPLSHQEIRLPAREENQQKVDKKSGRLKDLLSQEYQAMSGTNVRKNEAEEIRKSAIAMRPIFKNRAKLVKKEPVAKASSVSHDFLKKSVQEKGVSQQSSSSILYFGAQRDIKKEQVVSNKEIAKGQEITKSRVERLVSQRDSLQTKSSKGEASLGAYSTHQSKKSPKSQKSGVEAKSKGIINEGIAARSIQEDQRPLEGSHGIHKSHMFEAKGPKGRGEASLGAYSTHQSKKSPKSQKSGVEAKSKGIINEGMVAQSIREDHRPLKEVVSPSKEISVHQSGLEDSFKKVVEGSATLQNFQDQNQSSQSFEQYQDQGQTPHTHTPQESEGQLLEFQKRVLTIRLDHTQININFNANQLNLTFFSPAAFHNDGNLGEFIDEVMQQSGFDKYKVTLKDKQKRIEILSREKRRSSHPRSVIDVKV